MRCLIDSPVGGLPFVESAVHRCNAPRPHIAVHLLLAGICVLALASSSYAQALGAEAYFYGDMPVPAHVIADDFIERNVVPKLNLQQLGGLWLAAKTTPQPVDKTVDEYFKTRGKPSEDQRQTYISHLMLLKQLRNAIIAYEQLPLTPEAYAAHFGERGFPPASEKSNYLAKAAAFAKQGDRPQKATLKAAVSLLHERDRRSGVPVVSECHFENPNTRTQAFCTLEIAQIDGMLRDVIFAEKYPLDAQAVKLLAQYTQSSEATIRSRSSIIDTIQIMLRGTVSPQAEDFRLHRNAAIRNALKQSDEYRAALQKRQSQLPPVQRPRAKQQDPVAEFVAGMLVVAAAVGVYAEGERAERARIIAQNPDWKGHENDERCVVMQETWTRGFQVSTEYVTYCMSYTGHLRIAWDRCMGVQGFCRGR